MCCLANWIAHSLIFESLSWRDTSCVTCATLRTTRVPSLAPSRVGLLVLSVIAVRLVSARKHVTCSLRCCTALRTYSPANCFNSPDRKAIAIGSDGGVLYRNALSIFITKIMHNGAQPPAGVSVAKPRATYNFFCVIFILKIDRNLFISPGNSM